MYALSCLPSSIFVGRQGEKNYRTIEFDVSEWVAKFPQANIYIAAYRPDGYIYLPEVELAGDKLIWRVNETDAAAPGNGEIELRVADSELLGKSQKVVTMVTTSISGNGGSVPVPPPDWTEEAAALDARVTYLEEHGSGGGGMDIHALQPEDNIADADETPFYDASANAQRKTTWSNVKAKLKAYFDTLYLGASALVGYATQAWVQASYRTAAAQNAIDAQKAAASDVEAIEALIPSAATESNQLADKAFVNSTVGTNTAIFRGTFNSRAELEAYTGEKTNNDYAFVIGTDTNGNTVYNRYKYNGSTWVFEYALNNSSFTAAQWAAIQSGITSGDVALIQTALQPGALDDYAQKDDLDAKQDKDLIVNITYGGGLSNYIADKTNAEIYAAWQAGREVIASLNGGNSKISCVQADSTSAYFSLIINGDSVEAGAIEIATSGGTQTVNMYVKTLQPTTITDTAGYFTTDTVEGALAEIGAELSGINTLVGSGVIT